MNWMSAIGLESLSARLRANLNEGAMAAEDRLALARLEWSAQKQRLQAIFVLGVVLGGLTIVALVLLSLAVLIQFWDSPERSVVAWVIAGVWLLAWAGALALLLSFLRKSSQPFALTRAELARDWAVIKEKL
ncbi:phage holin family protein [Comamonas aquatica]|uniref:Phage holin family protein n=1 Tax=Comamonas aquatica TaxID=225991 RepID=A0AA42W013_9BURK|nr:phage holin family protein [Comamonas aquatica]MDH1429026.1 phage holin family protein [Comamonas aquatica]MDH1604903.1 phage holin family protein [Comamonas aquatica]MDH1615927.1 phage holin family protein [Comamonas aquatica]MDH2004792.1 phage holin family protein [Comamonas aquatica]